MRIEYYVGGITLRRILAIILSLILVIGMMSSGFVFADEVGTTYYVDDINGNDTNSGKSEGSAWKSLDKINSTEFSAGDKILLKESGAQIPSPLPFPAL